MTASTIGPRSEASQLAEALLARLTQITRLLTDHPVQGEWDVRDYTILSLMISELRDVLEYYRAHVADAERRIEASAHSLRELQALVAARREQA